MTHNVTSRQRKALAALLSGSSVTDAAEAAGVARRTMYRWFDQDGFKSALAEQERVALDAVSRRLIVLAEQAADTLKTAMTDGATDHVKVRAATVIMSSLLKVRELATLEDRIAELERRAGVG